MHFDQMTAKKKIQGHILIFKVTAEIVSFLHWPYVLLLSLFMLIGNRAMHFDQLATKTISRSYLYFQGHTANFHALIQIQLSLYLL